MHSWVIINTKCLVDSNAVVVCTSSLFLKQTISLKHCPWQSCLGPLLNTLVRFLLIWLQFHQWRDFLSIMVVLSMNFFCGYCIVRSFRRSHRSYCIKKVFLKISQISLEKILESFSIKVASLQGGNFVKKRVQHISFLVKFENFF